MCPPDLKIFMWSKALMLLLLHAGKAPLRRKLIHAEARISSTTSWFTIVLTFCEVRVVDVGVRTPGFEPVPLRHSTSDRSVAYQKG